MQQHKASAAPMPPPVNVTLRVDPVLRDPESGGRGPPFVDSQPHITPEVLSKAGALRHQVSSEASLFGLSSGGSAHKKSIENIPKNPITLRLELQAEARINYSLTLKLKGGK